MLLSIFYRNISTPVNITPPIKWQWRTRYWFILLDGEAGKDILSHAHFILSIRDLPSTAVPAPIQFTTLLEPCGTFWHQL